MENTTDNLRALSASGLLADLLWLEYQDAAAEAQAALCEGDKLRAIGLAIIAYKIRSRYEDALNRYVFG